MITFGLTGGVASGKSTVSKTIVANGIPVVDADIVARQVVEPGTPGLNSITNIFGTEILFEDGTLNRAKMSEQVFSHPEVQVRQLRMHSLNLIMRPLIEEESARQIKKLHDEGHPLVCYDAALIVEMGNADRYRPLIVVHCPRDTQVARLMSRNSLTHARAVDIIEAQMSGDAKCKYADYVIDTNGTIAESVFQSNLILQQIRSLVK